jgi:hypothetical protein
MATLVACAAEAAEARKLGALFLFHCLAALVGLVYFVAGHEAEAARVGVGGRRGIGAGGRGDGLFKHIALRLAAGCEEPKSRLDHGGRGVCGCVGGRGRRWKPELAYVEQWLLRMYSARGEM